jgi:hypothetical protein
MTQQGSRVNELSSRLTSSLASISPSSVSQLIQAASFSRINVPLSSSWRQQCCVASTVLNSYVTEILSSHRVRHHWSSQVSQSWVSRICPSSSCRITRLQVLRCRLFAGGLLHQSYVLGFGHLYCWVKFGLDLAWYRDKVFLRFF